MKVLYCSGFPISLNEDIKGGGNWITNLINAIIEYAPEIEPQLVMIDPKVKEIIFESTNKIPVVRIPSFQDNKMKRLLFARGWFDPYQNLVNDCKNIADILKPNVIQIFGYESQYIRLISNIDIPVCVHFQGFKDAINYKTDTTLIGKQLDAKLNLKRFLLGNMAHHNKKSSAITSYLKNAQFQKVDYVLGRTDWDSWVTKLVSPNAQYFYCQEIIRNIFFENFWAWPVNKKYTLFTVTKNSINKNIHLIFDIVHQLETHAPNFNFEWRIAGVQIHDTIPKLMVRKGKNSNKIKFLGNIGANDLICEMKNSHLFVLLSAIENSPNSLQEAMVLGMPVLSTYAGGVGSLVEHNESGFLVSEGEPYSIAGAILDLCNNPKKCIYLGKNAREKSIQRNTPEIVSKQVITAYNHILNSGK